MREGVAVTSKDDATLLAGYMEPTRIDVQVHGAVPADLAGAITGLIGEAYERLASPPRAPLEIRLADNREHMAELAVADKVRHGVTTMGDEAFICAHDAFEDRPRITVCVEALGDPRESPLAVATLRHEVGHAALHGRRTFYEVRIEPAIRQAVAARGLADPALLQLFFFIAVAVKDWEVSRLLLRHGFDREVRTLAWELLAPSGDDQMAWRIAESDPGVRLLWAASQLKPLLHAAPLRDVSEAAEVEARAGAMVPYLPPPTRQVLLELAWRLAGCLGGDTHASISRATQMLLDSGFCGLYVSG